jgi:hypothetical protein
MSGRNIGSRENHDNENSACHNRKRAFSLNHCIQYRDGLCTRPMDCSLPSNRGLFPLVSFPSCSDEAQRAGFICGQRITFGIICGSSQGVGHNMLSRVFPDFLVLFSWPSLTWYPTISSSFNCAINLYYTGRHLGV